MAESQESLAESILRLCAAAEPSPWYPSVYARETGLPRDRLDPHLDELRLGGLVKLTDWVQGLGQGYALTPAGREVLNDPRRLAQVRMGQWPKPVPAPAPARPGGTSTWDRGEAVREVLLNPAVPRFSQVLLTANFLVYGYGLLLAQQRGVALNSYLYGDQAQGVGTILNDLGALNGILFLQGQWWRLLTAGFVHIGLLHLGVNMYALFRIGPTAEQMWGHWRFLMLYLIADLTSSCAALVYGPGGIAGASGALCGLIAAEAAWVLVNRPFLPPPLVAAWTRQMGINLVLIIGISLVPGVSWAGHLGGALGGLAVGYLWHYQRFGVVWQRLAALLGIALVSVLAVGVMLWTVTHDFRWQVLRVQMLEESALDIYKAQVLPLVRRPVRDWGPQETRQAQQALAEVQKQFQQAVSILEQAGPRSDPQAEQERQRLLAGFRGKIATLQEAEQQLRGG